MMPEETGTLADVIPSGGSGYPLLARLPIDLEPLLSTNTVGDDLLAEIADALWNLRNEVAIDEDFVGGLEQLLRWLRSSTVGRDRAEYDWAIDRLKAIGDALRAQPPEKRRSHLISTLATK